MYFDIKLSMWVHFHCLNIYVIFFYSNLLKDEDSITISYQVTILGNEISMQINQYSTQKFDSSFGLSRHDNLFL